MLAALLPYDSSCWLSLDPATLLPTAHFTWQVDGNHIVAMAANEYLEDDVNKFAQLAAMPVPVGILSVATAGEPGRSARYRDLLASHGYQDGDELRATFRDMDTVWGCVAIHRRVGRFSLDEGRLVGGISGHLANGIRRAILRTTLELPPQPDHPGLIVLGSDDRIESATAPARAWLGELLDSTHGSAAVPLVVASIAHQARLAAAGGTKEVATLRLPRRSGGWLRLDASMLDEGDTGRVAIIVGQSREPEVATMIAEAYRLTRRERELTGLVLRGRSTEQIAELLGLSRYTVQDHLKSIFGKVGVRSRRELVAQLFLQQAAPRVAARVRIGSDGWFTEG